MIKSIESLVSSIQASPGIYAVLLGSGVSSAAQVPTGWQIKLNLVRRLAATKKVSPEPGPEVWYERVYGKAPNYSELLEEFGKTPAERQQLLRRYFEPTDTEREHGIKVPTEAHYAIASLVKQEYIRVIITTNFDRLMENALEGVGIVATVLSNEQQIKRAVPLIHTPCCVLKVHGDYLDPDIRNTPEELASYGPELSSLLNRILSEFGLIVCGWSAEWDVALSGAVYKAKSESGWFSTHWAVYGTPSSEARRLIKQCKATEITIGSADEFFVELQHGVEAIEGQMMTQPLSPAVAVGRLKRYLPEPKDRIRLRDLVDEAVIKAVDAMAGDLFDVSQPDEPLDEPVEHRSSRVRGYLDASEALLEMGPIAGYYGEPDHYDIWQHALAVLTEHTPGGANERCLGWKAVPATLLLYSLGLGALAANRLTFLGRMLATPVDRIMGKDSAAIRYLHPELWFYGLASNPVTLLGANGEETGTCQWLRDSLRVHCTRLIPNSSLYEYHLDRLEALMSFSYMHHFVGTSKLGVWAPLGLLAERPENAESILAEIATSVDALGDHSQYPVSGIGGPRHEDWRDGLSTVRNGLERLVEERQRTSSP